MNRGILFFLVVWQLCGMLNAQDRLTKKQQDSICLTAEKKTEPKRLPIVFPSVQITDEEKLKALKIAIPDSLSNINHPQHWFFNYYFKEPITDYDPSGDSLTYPEGDPLKYKLDRTYFWDINSDGLIDFLHYTVYYRALLITHDNYELFLLQPNGTYKMVQFNGYILNIKYNRDKSIKTLKTYVGACCTSRENYFQTYLFDKKKQQLVLKKSTLVLSCQYPVSH